LAWLGLAWLGLAWLGLAWLGLAWLGLAWLVAAFLKSSQWLASGERPNMFHHSLQAVKIGRTTLFDDEEGLTALFVRPSNPFFSHIRISLAM
jgi:hypothetical protein